jgi:RNA polymerase sigma factor for flagellar operon FliA
MGSAGTAALNDVDRFTPEPGSDPACAEEQALWQRLRDSGDPAARDALLVRHLPYAKTLAAVVYGQRVNKEDEFDDYLQLARMGLLEAMDRYDPARGAQFRTYAARRMRGAILNGIAMLTERHSQAHTRRRLLTERTSSLAHPAAEGEPFDVFKYLADVGMGLALGFMLEDTGMFTSDEASAATSPSPYRAIEVKQSRERLHGLIDQLSAQERKVIHHHYLQSMAFDDVARTMNLTKGRISQIHKKALETLRELMAQRSECDRSF